MATRQAFAETRAQRFALLADTPMTRIGPHTGAVGATWRTIQQILGQREMLGLLIRRDLKSRYKDSALGFVWSLIRPLTQLLIYYVVVGQFLGAARGIDNFAIYIFAGLTAFSLFSEIISGSTGSIVGNSGLIKKIYLPREIFPLASVGSALFNFMIQMVVLLVAALVIGKFPAQLSLLYFIPSFILIVIWGFAFGLLLAAANVYLRDIQYLVEVGLMVSMWASPIVYSWQAVSKNVHTALIVDIYTGNPLTLAVLGFHKALWVGSTTMLYPTHLLMRMGIAGVVGIILIFVFQRVFARVEGNFAQEL